MTRDVTASKEVGRGLEMHQEVRAVVLIQRPYVFSGKKMQWGKESLVLQVGLLRVSSHTSLLLAFELIVQQKQGLFIRLWRTHNSEHPFSCFVVRRLGNGNFRTGKATDLGDLGAASSNDTADHI